MAKSSSSIILTSALCFFLCLNLAHSHLDRFSVEGTVYCDTCRTQFITRVSQFMEGATVRVDCRDVVSGNLTLSKEAVTDGCGKYTVEVDGDHEDDMCEVSLVKSNDPECSELDHEVFKNDQAAKICITGNNGIVSPIRNANPLGFLRKTPLPECENIMKELGLLGEGGSGGSLRSRLNSFVH